LYCCCCIIVIYNLYHYRVIYYFDTPALGRRHQSFGRVTKQAQYRVWIVVWTAECQRLIMLNLRPLSFTLCPVSWQYPATLYPSCSWEHFYRYLVPNINMNQHVTPDLTTMTDSASYLGNYHFACW